jgi:hypothetical protein
MDKGNNSRLRQFQDLEHIRFALTASEVLLNFSGGSMNMNKRLNCDPIRFVVLLMIFTAACTTAPTETNIVPSASPFIAPSATYVPTDTPTEVSTSTPHPTITPTPPPEWVTNFAQPILDAIANRPPDFEDNFDQRSMVWKLASWCGDWRIRIESGEMVLTQCNAYIDHAYTDFVVEVDAHFTTADNAEDNPTLGIMFRMMEGDNGGYTYRVNYDGYITCSLTGSRDIYKSDYEQPANPGTQTNHLLLIAKGPEIALYLNGEPLAHLLDTSAIRGNVGLNVSSRSSFWKAEAAFDNFKIWDISDLP